MKYYKYLTPVLALISLTILYFTLHNQAQNKIISISKTPTSSAVDMISQTIATISRNPDSALLLKVSHNYGESTTDITSQIQYNGDNTVDIYAREYYDQHRKDESQTPHYHLSIKNHKLLVQKINF